MFPYYVIQILNFDFLQNWLLNVSIKFSLEELLEKVSARVLAMSGTDVISWPLMER